MSKKLTSFGKRVYALKDAKGIKLEWIAKQIHVSPRHLYRMLVGERNVENYKERILEILGE